MFVVRFFCDIKWKIFLYFSVEARGALNRHFVEKQYKYKFNIDCGKKIAVFFATMCA